MAGVADALDRTLPEEEQLSRWIALGVGAVGLVPVEGSAFDEGTFDRCAAAVMRELGPTRSLLDVLNDLPSPS